MTQQPHAAQISEEPFVFQVADALRHFLLEHSGENGVDFSIGTPPTSLAIRMKQMEMLFGTAEDPFTPDSFESQLFSVFSNLVFFMGRYESPGGRDDLRAQFGFTKDSLQKGISATVISGGTKKALALWHIVKDRFPNVKNVVASDKEADAALNNTKTVVVLSTPLMERCGLAVFVGPKKIVDEMQSLHIGLLGTPSAPQQDLFFLLNDPNIRRYLENEASFEEENCLSQILAFVSLVYHEPLAALQREGENLKKQFAQLFIKNFFPKPAATGKIQMVAGNGGGRQALAIIEKVLASKGVEHMILLKPHWSYHHVYRAMKLHSLPVGSDGQPDFALLEEALKQFSRDGKKANTAITINSPNNPTGAVYTRSNLEKLLQLCVKYNTYLVDDACYIHLVREREKEKPILLDLAFKMVQDGALKAAMLEKIYTAVSASKGLGMAGGRIGGILFSDAGIHEMVAAKYGEELPHLMAFFLGCQLMSDSKAFTELLREINHEIDERVLKVTAILDQHKVVYKKPAGAFYIEAEAPFLKKRVADMKAFALQMAREKGVAFMPMEVFGGKPYSIRLSLGGEKVPEQLQQETEIFLSHLLDLT